MGNQLAISNIVNISVAATQLGANSYNTSNLALFSDELPGNSFGNLGYSFYVDPTQVGIDFGTSSKTYAMALAIFSQQPNILTGGGQLIIILLGVATQQLAFSGVSASGAFTIQYNSNTTSSLAWNATASQIQTALQALPGLAGVKVSGSISSETVTIQMGGVYGASPSAFTIPTNTLMTSIPASVTITVSETIMGKTIGAAITANSTVVQFFGILVTETADAIGATDLPLAAAVVQAMNKIAFWVGYLEADIEASGLLYNLMTGDFTHNRGLYYGDNAVVNGYIGWNAMTMAAAYASLGLSVNFSGSNTTLTMNLKGLATIQPDPTMTQSIYNFAKTAGADIYVSIQGVSKVLSFGANSYYDQVYNLGWIVGALQIAGFNFLAETNTKIPQTESGMDGLKAAYRSICQQGVVNQYLAPGVWNSPNSFGNPADLINNVAQFGYYIFSQPIAQQAQTDRVARVAPLIQIALKESGAIQSSTVIIYVNA